MAILPHITLFPFLAWVVSQGQRHAGLQHLHLQPVTFILVRTVLFWSRGNADILERRHSVILSGGKVKEHDPKGLLMAVWIPQVQRQLGYCSRNKGIDKSLKLIQIGPGVQHRNHGGAGAGPFRTNPRDSSLKTPKTASIQTHPPLGKENMKHKPRD